MYRTPVIIGKISPDRANKTPTHSEGVLLALKGHIFDNDRRRSIHYPAYYTATCQNKKNNFTWCVFLQFICYRQHS